MQRKEAEYQEAEYKVVKYQFIFIIYSSKGQQIIYKSLENQKDQWTLCYLLKLHHTHTAEFDILWLQEEEKFMKSAYS